MNKGVRTMTVAELITELEKIEDKTLEVECQSHGEFDVVQEVYISKRRLYCDKGEQTKVTITN